MPNKHRKNSNCDKSATLGYVAYSDRGGYYVGVGEQEGEFFDNIYTQPVFSADGKKLAYGALKGRELWWKVLDLK